MVNSPRPIATLAALVFLLLAACGSSDAPTEAADDSTTTTTAPTSTTTDAPDDAVTTTAVPETESDPAEATVSTEPPPAAADFLSGSMLAPVGERTLWSGVIDDDIELSLWVAQQGDYLRGELTYRTSGQPIAILGQAYESGEGYYLHEFGDDGRVSGTLILPSVQDGQVADATWGGRDLTLTFDGVSSEPYFFDPLVRSGIYTYAFDPFGQDDELCCGATGSVQISAVTQTSVVLDIENVTSGPGFNLAIIEPVEIPLVNNVARYEVTDELMDCAFDVTVFDGFAFIEHIDERYTCLFGNAAGVEGIYLRTGSVIEPEDSTFYGATLNTTGFGGVALGDTWASLTERFGVPAFTEADDFFGGGCYYVEIPNDSLSPWIMLLGEGNDAVVSRIEPVLENQRADESGLGIGSTEAEIDAFYGDAVIKEPHLYLGEGAKYLRIAPADGAASTILFETNEAGAVLALRNGYLDPIRWVEGCA